MRSDERAATARRVSELLAQGRSGRDHDFAPPGADPGHTGGPAADERVGTRPDSWPHVGSDDERPDAWPDSPSDSGHGSWPDEWPADVPASGGADSGPRWEISARAAVAFALLTVIIAGVAGFALLRGPSSGGTVVPARETGPGGAAVTMREPTAVPIASAAPSPFPVTGATGAPVPSGGPSLRVYVVGQVRRPGVVSVGAGARVEDAVQAAGGPGPKADLAVMNLARPVVDGERISVPRPGETPAVEPPVPDDGVPGSGVPGSGVSGSEASGGAAGAASGGAAGAPIDLNTATVAQLDALPGVGPVIAGRIVAWRQENGRFSRVDDLTEVQGIGDATFARLRPLVRV
jgi:competence protein ComEA